MSEKTVIVPKKEVSFTGEYSMRDIEDTIVQAMDKTRYKHVNTNQEIHVNDATKEHIFIHTFEAKQPLDHLTCRIVVTCTYVFEPTTITVGDSLKAMQKGTAKISMKGGTYAFREQVVREDVANIFAPRKSHFISTLFRKLVTPAGYQPFGYDMKSIINGLAEKLTEVFEHEA